MNAMLGAENSNSVAQNIVNAMNGSTSHNDTAAFPHPREHSSQENKIRENNNENEVPRLERLIKSIEIFSNEMNTRLSEEVNSIMNMMHSEINKIIRSAVSDRVIPEIQDMV